MPLDPLSPMLPVPFVLQQAEGDCLAACAAMVLGYLGIAAEYRTLIRTLDVKDFGTAFSNLQRLQRLGVSVTLQENSSLAYLRQQLQQNHPCIVPVETAELPYWNGESVYHALVVIGIDADSVYLHDPAFRNGPLRVTQGDFGLAWLERDETLAVISKR